MSIEITLAQAEGLVEVFGGDKDLELSVVRGDENFHSGAGLYAHDDYPEHGFFFLGKGA